MLRIDQIRLLPGDSEALLPVKCARILRLPAEDIVSCAVLRRAIDAREGLTLVYTAAVEVKREDTVLRRCRDKRVSRYAPETYALPAAVTAPEIPPIVVGAGPAGLFAALVLARCGARPIVLERGRPVEQRQADVERFWSGGALDTESNVQFGEGGAGAFCATGSLWRRWCAAARRRASSRTPSPMWAPICCTSPCAACAGS